MTISFQRATEDGWRWSPGYRTRKIDDHSLANHGSWIVQHWTGPELCWATLNYANSYAEARAIATEHFNGSK